MVYTVTFNPAVDYTVHMDEVRSGCVNRAVSEQIFIGGKGINVSVILKELGIESVALGFTAGFTGEAVESGLAAMGVKTDFVRLPTGFSRINVKIKTDTETELNGCGPTIDSRSAEMLSKKLDRLRDGDCLVLAGSVPKSLPDNIYEKIIAALSDRNIRICVDAEKGLLMNVLKYRPFLIKPNDAELGGIFGKELRTSDEIFPYAEKLHEMGAQNVVVSMAERGAVLVDGNGKKYFCPACKGKAVNSVGAGDSMLAGFLAGTLTGDSAYALRLGTAAGAATAFSEGLGVREYIMRLFEETECGCVG